MFGGFIIFRCTLLSARYFLYLDFVIIVEYLAVLSRKLFPVFASTSSSSFEHKIRFPATFVLLLPLPTRRTIVNFLTYYAVEALPRPLPQLDTGKFWPSLSEVRAAFAFCICF